MSIYCLLIDILAFILCSSSSMMAAKTAFKLQERPPSVSKQNDVGFLAFSEGIPSRARFAETDTI